MNASQVGLGCLLEAAVLSFNRALRPRAARGWSLPGTRKLKFRHSFLGLGQSWAAFCRGHRAAGSGQRGQQSLANSHYAAKTLTLQALVFPRGGATFQECWVLSILIAGMCYCKWVAWHSCALRDVMICLKTIGSFTNERWFVMITDASISCGHIGSNKYVAAPKKCICVCIWNGNRKTVSCF